MKLCLEPGTAVPVTLVNTPRNFSISLPLFTKSSIVFYHETMDKNNAAGPQTNNANAPGTYVTPADPNIRENISAGRAAAFNSVSNDPSAPYAADPLNAGNPTRSAVEEADGSEPDGVLELELGGTGTIIVSGILSQADYNPDLSGWKRVDIYDQMRKGDATVRLGLSAIKQPLLSAGWYIKPGKDGKEDDPYVQFIDEELFKNPNFSFTQFLRQALLFCDYGNSFFEKVWRVRADGKIGWKKFAPRLPKTIWRYTLQDGVTPGITQILPTGGNVEIPQWKLLMFVNEMEGANYEGISLLRAAYKHWYYKDTYYKIDAISSERQGMGVPIIKVPPQADPRDKAKAKVIAKNLRVNEMAYVDLPIGFTLEYLDMKGKDIKNVHEMVLHHDRQILKAFLAQYLDMGGAGSSGATKSLSDDQSELFLVAEKYIANIFQEQMNYAIHELIDLNFTGSQAPKPTEYPTLDPGGIGQVDFAQLSQALMQMVDSGIILSDANLERYVRQTMDLPEAMPFDKQDPADVERRRVGTSQVVEKLDGPPGSAPDQGNAPGKPKPKSTQTNGKSTQKAQTFAENLLTLQNGIQDALSERGY